MFEDQGIKIKLHGHRMKRSYITTSCIGVVSSPAGAVANYCDEHICLSVCLSVCPSIREDISETTHAIFSNFSVHVAYGHGSVLRQGDERGKGSFGGFLPD